MTRISGIKTEKYNDGKLKSVTFDFNKYEEILRPILKRLGVTHEEDSRIKGKFRSVDEAKTETKRRLTKLCKEDKLL